jgi:hypothetical protein
MPMVLVPGLAALLLPFALSPYSASLPGLVVESDLVLAFQIIPS